MVQSIDKKQATREADTLDADLLGAIAVMPKNLKLAVLDYAEYLISKHTQNNSASTTQSQEPQKKRQAGLLKGKIWIADDFDAPLEEMQDYM
jgi:Protein of unknown function (DUF2281)